MSEEIIKELFIRSLQSEKIDGCKYIPTMVTEDAEGNVVVGAQAQALIPNQIVNQNFKVDLGEHAPGSSLDARGKFKSAFSKKKSAYQLTKDYFNCVLKPIETTFSSLTKEKPKYPAKIIVAEPLSFQIKGIDPKWINNYRENIRRILSRYEEVQFLPEPFAVYQYYRYGIRLPGLTDNKKHIAFIIDFGGGTFDACIIESTNKGDISLSGKHARPLSADSVPVGGFKINRELAKKIVKIDLPNGVDRANFDKYVDQYERVSKGDLDEDTLSDKYRIFKFNFEKLERRVEEYKINLVNRISDWNLDSENYIKVQIDVPKDIFSSNEWVTKELIDHQFKEVFEHEIWNKRLKHTVKTVLKRASESLSDRKVDMTLISGGSSNIGWLQKLLQRDFSGDLENAKPVAINQSFQEVVSMGLAIECARRYFESESEFVGVTYNPIKLYLNPDESGLERDKRYRSIGERVSMANTKPGDLLASAQSLRHFYGSPLQWQVKLKKSPKSKLEYYFARPGDGEDNVDYYNVEETCVYTKENAFDAQIIVELTAREDGTINPKFIYKKENYEFGVKENSVKAKPFAIDATTAPIREKSLNRYIGFDFGTSNSSVCVLDSSKIDLIKTRSEDDSWLGLSDALPFLPYPVAFQVRRFLSEHKQEALADVAREAFESCLAFMAYVCAAECSLNYDIEDVIKNYQHRSMGPLKAMLESSAKKIGNSAIFSRTFCEWNKKEYLAIDKAIADFNDHKHHKLGVSEVNWEEHLALAVKPIERNARKFEFGYCATCFSRPFDTSKFSGQYVIAHDQAPFPSRYVYESDISLSESISLYVDKEKRDALSLTPFIFWFNRKKPGMTLGCYWLDKFTDSSAIVKSADELLALTCEKLEPSLVPIMNNLKNSGKMLDARTQLLKGDKQ